MQAMSRIDSIDIDEFIRLERTFRSHAIESAKILIDACAKCRNDSPWILHAERADSSWILGDNCNILYCDRAVVVSDSHDNAKRAVMSALTTFGGMMRGVMTMPRADQAEIFKQLFTCGNSIYLAVSAWIGWRGKAVDRCCSAVDALVKSGVDLYAAAVSLDIDIIDS